MCMRSGLVIKTAPIVRSSLSSRFQSDCLQTRAGSRQLSPSPNQLPTEAGSSDSSEATPGVSGGGMAKTGAGRSGGAVIRARSLDFLSIVTRFQFARRVRNDTDTVDQDAMYNALELDLLPHDSSRSLYYTSICVDTCDRCYKYCRKKHVQGKVSLVIDMPSVRTLNCLVLGSS